MELNKVEKLKMLRKNKRLGRGESSGKGKTSARGHKGQKSRTGKKIRLGFEGGQLPLIKRLPFRRGVGNSIAKENITITFDQLAVFDSGATVDESSLRQKGILGKTTRPFIVKLVAKGQPTKPLNIKIAVTKRAKDLVEKAKGKVEIEKVLNVEEKETNA